MGVVTAIAAGASLIGGVAGAVGANKREKRANSAAAAKAREIDQLERTRQDVINPYDNMTNLSGMAEDLSGMSKDRSSLYSDISGMAENLSGMVDNQYANLGVSTQAAQFQAEEADLSLANSLDAMQASGASAGGATALANAALRSKRGIAASLEQQEAANMKLRAQGAESTQNIRMSEAQRIQQVQMSEARNMQSVKFGEARRMDDLRMSEAGRLQQFGIAEAQRMQNADVAGRTFEWNAQENRDAAKLGRLSGQMQNQQQMAANAGAQKTQAIMGGIQGVASAATSWATNSAATAASDKKAANAKAHQRKNNGTVTANASGIQPIETPKYMPTGPV